MPRGISLAKTKRKNVNLASRKINPRNASKTGPTEHSEQAAFFMWVKFKYPDLVVYAIPNDAKRSVYVAALKRAEGLTAGVPDVTLDEARGGYFGLKLEFKKTSLKLKRDRAKQPINLNLAKTNPRFTDLPKVVLPFNGTPDEEGLGGLSPEQKQLRARMRAKGYRVVTVYGFDHARQETDWYMSRPLTIGIVGLPPRQ